MFVPPQICVAVYSLGGCSPALPCLPCCRPRPLVLLLVVVGLQPLVDPRTLQRRPPTQPTNPTNLTGQRQKSLMHQTSIFSIYIGGEVASTLIWNLDLHFMRTPSPLQAPAARPYKRASKAPKLRQTSPGSLLFHKLPPPTHQIGLLLSSHTP